MAAIPQVCHHAPTPRLPDTKANTVWQAACLFCKSGEGLTRQTRRGVTSVTCSFYIGIYLIMSIALFIFCHYSIYFFVGLHRHTFRLITCCIVYLFIHPVIASVVLCQYYFIILLTFGLRVCVFLCIIRFISLIFSYFNTYAGTVANRTLNHYNKYNNITLTCTNHGLEEK